jgi:galactoside O-acetyltransferase
MHKIIDILYTAFVVLRGAHIGRSSRLSFSTEIDRAANVRIGSQCRIYKNVTIYLSQSGQFELGNGSHIAPFCYFLIDKNRMTVGEHVAIGPYAAFFCHSNHYSSEAHLFVNTYLDGDITIGSNVFIGAHTVVLPDTYIEDNVIVGANSVVRGRLESGYLYAGNPVKKIRRVFT